MIVLAKEGFLRDCEVDGDGDEDGRSFDGGCVGSSDKECEEVENVSSRSTVSRSTWVTRTSREFVSEENMTRNLAQAMMTQAELALAVEYVLQ